MGKKTGEAYEVVCEHHISWMERDLTEINFSFPFPPPPPNQCHFPLAVFGRLNSLAFPSSPALFFSLSSCLLWNWGFGGGKRAALPRALFYTQLRFHPAPSHTPVSLSNRKPLWYINEVCCSHRLRLRIYEGSDQINWAAVGVFS